MTEDKTIGIAGARSAARGETAAVRVRVPASSANLGPGYDCFGLALARYDEVTVRPTESGLAVHIEGVGANSLPRTDGHLIVQALRRTIAELGEAAPGLDVRCVNRIPHGSGQGSSAAAIVAGVLAARALLPQGVRRLPDPAVLSLACAIEGHPDNVAPALLGGFTIAWTDRKGGIRAVRRDVHPGIRAVLFSADQSVPTRHARTLLPERIDHAAAAANSACTALLVHAITADPSLLLEATEDRLHQVFRSPVMPGSMALVTELRSAGIAAVLSGAGPSVLALTVGDLPDGVGVPGFTRTPVGLDRQGALVSIVT